MQYSKLNKSAIKSWFIARAITTIILGVVLLFIRFLGKFAILYFFNETILFFCDIALALIIFFLLLNTFLYPIIEYKQWKYNITDSRVDFSEGIYATKRTILPIIRIQHIKINQGPINKLLNLANITMVTAGGSHTIPNIDIKTAEKIGDYLNLKVKEKVQNHECI